MTTVSSVIKAALRESNIIPLGKTPSDAEYAEGLERLQALVLSTLGNEMGENLSPIPIGRNEIVAPANYPWYGNQPPAIYFLPTNSRVMANLTAPATVNLHPMPNDGARMGVVDVSQNFGTFPLTIVANGRSIEGTDVLMLDTSGVTREWFYRGDTGNWVRLTDLTLDSEMPFPREFDDMFITFLAMRLNPRYGQSLDPQSGEIFKRARSQFRARYKQEKQMHSEEGLLRLTNQGRWHSRYYGNNSEFFTTGYPF